MVKNILKTCNVNIINEKEEIEEKISFDDKFNVIFSYIIYKDNFLYYLYTKNNLRGKKYAQRLLESAGFKDKNINIRLFTKNGYFFLKKKLDKNIFYHPISI